ncbi:hypothetical protein BaRGS_00033587 [Batillaria attramentaria]|uniref:Uncharacterized protein n=1 Tax=Batillaria attramentaria TaxID=370345 RepID=A0ABD0JKK1_9CAEN
MWANLPLLHQLAPKTLTTGDGGWAPPLSVSNLFWSFLGNIITWARRADTARGTQAEASCVEKFTAAQNNITPHPAPSTFCAGRGKYQDPSNKYKRSRTQKVTSRHGLGGAEVNLHDLNQGSEPQGVNQGKQPEVSSNRDSDREAEVRVLVASACASVSPRLPLRVSRASRYRRCCPLADRRQAS